MFSNSNSKTCLVAVVCLFVFFESNAETLILAGEERYYPIFENGPLIKTKWPARLPEDPAASCEHSGIHVKFHISTEGKVYGLRLTNPVKDYLYLESIAKAVSRWKFKPEKREGFAVVVRNVEYEFVMSRDFSDCIR